MYLKSALYIETVEEVKLYSVGNREAVNIPDGAHMIRFLFQITQFESTVKDGVIRGHLCSQGRRPDKKTPAIVQESYSEGLK